MSPKVRELLEEAGLDERMHDMLLDEPMRIWRITSGGGCTVEAALERFQYLKRNPTFSLEVPLLPCVWPAEIPAELADRLKAALTENGRTFIDSP
jgi:hypothetical protein